jgi:DNA polymerase elongation subunit (family B)
MGVCVCVCVYIYNFQNFNFSMLALTCKKHTYKLYVGKENGRRESITYFCD